MERIKIKIKKLKFKRELYETYITLPRYVAVGIVGVFIGMLAIWFFTEVIGLFYLISGIIGAIFSILNDFIFNEIWTFSYRRREGQFLSRIIKRFARFILTKAFGFLIAISTLAFFTQAVGLHYLVSNFIAVAASFIWNYAMSSYWVWAWKRNKRNGKGNQAK